MADQGLKILVVDDDDVDRMAVRRALKATGLDATVTEAENAEEALALIGKHAFDCTLLDYRMPGSDGLDVVRRAREQGFLVPFIMLTGFGDEQTAVELMKAGAADYLPKSSLTAERLALSLRGVLRIHQAEIEASKADIELRRYAAQLRSVAQAALEINATLAVDAMLQATTENARRILSARYAETRLTVDAQPGDGSLEGQQAMWRASAPLEDEQELTSWADATRDEMPGITPEILAMLAANPDAPMPSIPGFRVPNTITAELGGRDGRNLGTIQLWDKKDGAEFDDADEAILTQLAQLASVALENARLFRAAQDATRARDDLVAIVSHDLRNPVHTIHMAASFLLDIAPTNDRRVQARRQLEVIQRSATRANRLIQDLLDVARIQAGGLAVDPVPVDVESLLTEAAESATPLASAAHLTVACEPPQQAIKVASDRERVLQVFANLIGNAIKFTPKGGSIRIIACHESNDEVRFTIADSGPGIPPEHLDHVFDRYWQARSTAKLGAGLGLSIAKGIVEAHGGRIWAESPPGSGAQFNFTLPVG